MKEVGKHIHRKGTIPQVTVSDLGNTKGLRRVHSFKCGNDDFLFVLCIQSYWDKISVQEATIDV